MKYSQLIGVIFATCLIAACFMPWSFVPGKQIVITGLQATGTQFGKPGLMNIYLSSLCIILFTLPKIWAKRTNLFIAALNIAWSVRNYLLVTSCYVGECPEKRSGIYLLLFFSAGMLIMTFLPKIAISEK